jgi:general secretion pathway protein L
VSLLRIHCSLAEAPPGCRWALVNAGRDTVVGEGELATLPRHASRVQVVLPASQVLFVRVRLPPMRRRPTGTALGFAAEEQTAGDPALNQVRWLGRAGDEDVLAVFDQAGFDAWRTALAAAGLANVEWQSETLLLPWQPGRWQLRWNGSEGFVRTGELEGLATDRGDAATPPAALRLRLAQARADAEAPTAIVLQATAAEAMPDLVAWSRELGVPCVRAADGDSGDWTRAPGDAGVPLGERGRHRALWSGLAPRLRTAAWVLGLALALHGLLLVGEWAALAKARADLRAGMESRFRTTFPEAVAVADPVLQMRRQLAQARHAAGQPDPGDFPALLAPLGDAARDLPAGSLRALSYRGAQLDVELAGVDAAGLARLQAQLEQAGLQVRARPPPTPGAVAGLTVASP